eukprot:8290930-Karenia_brevis.AAC.1
MQRLTTGMVRHNSKSSDGLPGFQEFDVPGDGSCFLFAEMLHDVGLHVEFSTQPRYQNGIPKNSKRYAKERQMLEEWFGNEELGKTNSVDVFMQDVVHKLNLCVSQKCMIELQDLPSYCRLRQKRVRVHLTPEALASMGEVFGGESSREFGNDGELTHLQFCFTTDAAGQKHGHWQALVPYGQVVPIEKVGESLPGEDAVAIPAE